MPTSTKIVVVVRWEDSASIEGWQDADTYAEPVKCNTVGYMVKDEAEYILLAATLDENGRWCGGMAIPKSAVRSVEAWEPSGDS